MSQTLLCTGSCALSGTSKRALHLVDVENLLRGTSPTPAELGWLMEAYRRASRWAEGDQMQVGSSSRVAKRSVWAWRESYPCAWHVGDGPDGGESALLRNCPPEYAAGFATVVIGSGDHAFAPLAGDLASRDVHVRVVARPEALSRQLHLAARETVSLGSTLRSIRPGRFTTPA
jgi:hypothetical protein